MRVQTYCSTLFHFLSNGKNNIQVETTYTVSTRLDNFAHISYTDKLACLSWMQDPTAGMFYRDQKQVFCLHRTRKTTYRNKETTLLVYFKEHNKEQSKCIWVLLARGKIQTTRKPPTMQEKNRAATTTLVNYSAKGPTNTHHKDTLSMKKRACHTHIVNNNLMNRKGEMSPCRVLEKAATCSPPTTR
jgi:hypothetical protein